MMILTEGPIALRQNFLGQSNFNDLNCAPPVLPFEAQTTFNIPAISTSIPSNTYTLKIPQRESFWEQANRVFNPVADVFGFVARKTIAPDYLIGLTRERKKFTLPGTYQVKKDGIYQQGNQISDNLYIAQHLLQNGITGFRVSEKLDPRLISRSILTGQEVDGRIKFSIDRYQAPDLLSEIRSRLSAREDELATKLILNTSNLLCLSGAGVLTSQLITNLNSGNFVSDSIQVLRFLSMSYLFASSWAYQTARLAVYDHPQKFSEVTPIEREVIYSEKAPSVKILVPSYKEPVEIVEKTIWASVLQEYRNKEVVLLIDDPFPAKTEADQKAVTDMLEMLGRVRAELENLQARYSSVREIANNAEEYERLACVYREIAAWFFEKGKSYFNPALSDDYFTRVTFLERGKYYQKLAEDFDLKANQGISVNANEIAQEYQKISQIFSTRISEFQRKKHAELSHAPNKAMNINAYLQSAKTSSDRSDYVMVIDSDTIVDSQYLAEMIPTMERAENRDVAVIHSPTKVIPFAENEVERVSQVDFVGDNLSWKGATTFNAAFWMGTNGVIRTAALEDIAETATEDGKQVTSYLRDKTVIEDFETTAELLRKNWRIFHVRNDRSKAIFPADLNDLVLQRHRWADGGLPVLGKLLPYFVNNFRFSPEYFKEVIYRTLMCVSHTVEPAMLVLNLLTNPLAFPGINVAGPLLGSVAGLSMSQQYRDIRKDNLSFNDLLNNRVLGYLFLPIRAAATLSSLNQMLTKKRIPFKRTPKRKDGNEPLPAGFTLPNKAIFGTALLGAGYTTLISHTSPLLYLGLAAFYGYGIKKFIKK